MDFQSTLFADALGREPLEESLRDSERHALAHGAWVDVRRSWLPDPDDVLDALVREVPWRAERRQMYDRLVDVPRLVYTYMGDQPRGGGDSLAFELGHGDLLVMGGSCQRTWEHAVPKVAHAGPRLSVQFRPFGVF